MNKSYDRVDVFDLIDDLADKQNVRAGDILWYSWPTVFGSTAGPGSGVGGQLMTTVQVYAFDLQDGRMFKYCTGYWKEWNGQFMESW